MANPLAKLDRGLPLTRGERLNVQFREAVDRIETGRSSQLDPGELADYLALGWLQGAGGDLRLTVRGVGVYDEMLRTRAQPSPAHRAQAAAAGARRPSVPLR